MSKDGLINSILAYIGEVKTDYAILINGDWGSGKTFFITNQLFNAVKNKYRDMRCVHISLNGLENLDEIYQKIVVELLSNRKVAGFGFGMLKTLSDLDIEIPKIGLKPKNIIKVLKDTSLVIARESNKSPDILLCFDDLERISPNTRIEAVLGYIYTNFIERKHMKVLLISNEVKIDSSTYLQGKEKIVGRTFLFAPSVRAVFPQILSEIVYSNKSAELIQTEKDFLLALFEDYKITNLRTLQFVVRALDTICSAIPEVKAETFHKVVFFTSILSFEYRKGTLKSEDAHKLNNLETMALAKAITGKTQKQLPPTYEDNFYNTYVILHREEYQYFQSIVDLVLSGYFDKESFLSEIKKFEPDTLSPEQEAKQKILHFRQLSDEDFQKTTKEVSFYLLKGAYGIVDFLHMCLFLTYFYDKGLISEDPQGMLEKASKIVIDNLQDDTIKSYLLFGRISISSEEATQTFRKIREAIDKSIEKKREAQKRSSVGAFFSTLLRGDKKAWVLYKDIESESIFLYIDIKDLAPSILSAPSTVVTSFSELLKYRYLRITNARDFHNNEIPVLSDLMNTIKKGVDDLTDQPLLKLIFNELIEDFEKVIAHLGIEK